jgi:hypothetical protein
MHMETLRDIKGYLYNKEYSLTDPGPFASSMQTRKTDQLVVRLGPHCLIDLTEGLVAGHESVASSHVVDEVPSTVQTRRHLEQFQVWQMHPRT